MAPKRGPIVFRKNKGLGLDDKILPQNYDVNLWLQAVGLPACIAGGGYQSQVVEGQ